MLYRVYFNRELEWPQAWSVDEGSQATEINVVGFRITDCPVTSHTLSREQRDGLSAKNTPFAWLEVEGNLELRGGIAIFKPV